MITSKIGILGEDLAESFLVKRGFKIIERNHLKKWGEIDIVAKKDKSIRFVEVKAVSCPSFGVLTKEDEIIGKYVSRETYLDGFRPEENVHKYKLERLNRVIQTYLSQNRVSPETPYQIDVVAVWIDVKTKYARVELLENVGEFG